MYVRPDFQTKKALREAVEHGRIVEIYSPGVFPAPQNGTAHVEGPHGVHKWYAAVEVKEGVVVDVK